MNLGGLKAKTERLLAVGIVTFCFAGLYYVKATIYDREAAGGSAGAGFLLWVSIGMWLAGLTSTGIIFVATADRGEDRVVSNSELGNCCINVCLTVLCVVFWFLILR